MKLFFHRTDLFRDEGWMGAPANWNKPYYSNGDKVDSRHGGPSISGKLLLT